MVTSDSFDNYNELKHPDIKDIKCKTRLRSQPCQFRKETL